MAFEKINGEWVYFEDEVSLSGKTYNTSSSVAPWLVRRSNKDLKKNLGKSYLDEEGNIIPEEIERIMNEKEYF